MLTPLDLTGRVFSRLTVLGPAPKRGRKRCWSCRCVCGSVTVVRTSNLTSGNSKSCGCSPNKPSTVRGAIAMGRRAIIRVQDGAVFPSLALAGRVVGANPANIARSCIAQKRRAGGFNWRFASKAEQERCEAVARALGD
jgi:hypothetical protein